MTLFGRSCLIEIAGSLSLTVSDAFDFRPLNAPSASRVPRELSSESVPGHTPTTLAGQPTGTVTVAVFVIKIVFGAVRIITGGLAGVVPDGVDVGGGIVGVGVKPPPPGGEPLPPPPPPPPPPGRGALSLST